MEFVVNSFVEGSFSNDGAALEVGVGGGCWWAGLGEERAVIISETL